MLFAWHMWEIWDIIMPTCIEPPSLSVCLSARACQPVWTCHFEIIIWFLSISSHEFSPRLPFHWKSSTITVLSHLLCLCSSKENLNRDYPGTVQCPPHSPLGVGNVLFSGYILLTSDHSPTDLKLSLSHHRKPESKPRLVFFQLNFQCFQSEKMSQFPTYLTWNDSKITI